MARMRPARISPTIWNPESMPIVLVLIWKFEDMPNFMEHCGVIAAPPMATSPAQRLPASIVRAGLHIDECIRCSIPFWCRCEEEIVLRICFYIKAEDYMTLAG